MCIRALGGVTDPEALKDVLEFNFNKEPPSNAVSQADMHFLGATLADNAVARPMHWNHMKHNWDAVRSKINNIIVLDRYVKQVLARFTTDAEVEEVAEFFKDKDIKGFDRSLENAKDRSRGRAAYRKRDAGALKEWLKANGY